DVERGPSRVAQVGERFRILGRTLGAEGRERVEGHDPGRDRRREDLGIERTERHRLPTLDVARAPVVHEQEPEDVLLRAFYGDGLAEAVLDSDDETDLELEI